MTNNKIKSHWFLRIAEGDKTAFDAFFKHYYPKLLLFARIYVNSKPQAEDVVAEVLTNMLHHRERVFKLDHFEAYLYTSVKNKALTNIKREERSESFPIEIHSISPVLKTTIDPHAVLVEQELRSWVNTITQNFPPKRKRVFQLIKEDGLSYRQTAESMQISERTVEVHLKLAVKELREGIEKYLRMGKEKKVMQDY